MGLRGRHYGGGAQAGSATGGREIHIRMNSNIHTGYEKQIFITNMRVFLFHTRYESSSWGARPKVHVFERRNHTIKTIDAAQRARDAVTALLSSCGTMSSCKPHAHLRRKFCVHLCTDFHCNASTSTVALFASISI